jgi:glycosyltransferase involved in cell wall biosynthesis
MRDSALVSCIMPTRNRRHLVGQALAYFLRQDYPRKELIVVDDGDDCIVDILPVDPRVRYIRLAGKTPLGTARNLACQASRGDLIAHWDDDDWMAPDRLSVQVAALLAADASVTGLRDVLYYRLQAGEAWLYRGVSAWPVGATLLYRRSVWQAHRFDDVAVGEDTAFLARLAAERVHASMDSSFYVGLLHANNTAPKNLLDPAWEHRPLDEVTHRLWSDRAFYARLRNGHAVSEPEASRATTGIALAADFDVTTGYGSMAEYLALGMARAGANVTVAPLAPPTPGLSSEFQALPRGEPAIDAPTVYFSWPRLELDRFRQADLFINTMWESSALPADWPAALNRARAVIVPTRFVAQVCRASGVRVPIAVIPEGVDPAVYTCVDRPADRPLTTLIVAPLEPRKHVGEAIAAWRRAFAADADARLIVKTNAALATRDHRIRIVTDAERTRGIAHWYAQADVLLALGNEGFGLPLVEAMATGLPVIALNAEGQSDVCADSGEAVLAVAPGSWEPHVSSMFGACGMRAVPDVDVVADRLAWIATHRGEARAMGRAAADWVARERNVWHKGPAVLDVMERHVARPLRRRVHVWVSSWRTQCGIAEYTAHLADELPTATGVHVSAQEPEIARTRVLHVQHQYGLYDEAALARTCSAAHHAGVPVVVTEHMVRPDPPPCEREADVLVSMASAGVEVLRRRWPSMRVEHIPHGCATWFPRRKRRRGRVIGSFGFMAPHKGFTRLVDLTRSGMRMVLYSVRGSDEAEAAWVAARNGEVRRETRFLPVEEVARRLAAEADVLVFWYDEIDVATVSGAVRVGLASGVPVLTSPTTWFADVRDVTYQPLDLEDGVQRLLDDTQLRQRLVESATEYCHEHSWTRIGERHLALWRSVQN